LTWIRRQGDTPWPQGIRRTSPHRGCRLAAQEVYHRSLWASDASNGSRRGTENLRGSARRARPRCGKAGVETPTDPSAALIEVFIVQHTSKTRKAREVSRMLRREVVSRWGTRSVREINKRAVIELISEIAQRGTPMAANKLLKVVKTFLNWCVGRAIIDTSP